MNLVVALEHRFVRSPDGVVWTKTMFSYSFWRRYLNAFDRVQVVARVLDAPSAPLDWKQASGECVSFSAIPCFVGPWQYLLRLSETRGLLARSIDSSSAYLLRVPGTVGGMLWNGLRKQQYPYGVEVVSDPYDVFAPGAIKHLLRPVFRQLFVRRLKRQCSGAKAAAYVTREALQCRYPPDQEAYSTSYSDVELPDEAFAPSPRLKPRSPSPFTLITVGTLDQLYKAPDILIDAVAICVSSGLDLRLVLVGGGKYQATLEAKAAKQGLGHRVRFAGQLSAGNEVRAQLDNADLFVLPSKTEGLPRALIEAMARAMPCIGSSVGGIPELLSPEDLFEPGDIGVLANKIQEVARDPERLIRMSVRNFREAGEYHEERLSTRRMDFYEFLKQTTEKHLRLNR